MLFLMSKDKENLGKENENTKKNWCKRKLFAPLFCFLLLFISIFCCSCTNKDEREDVGLKPNIQSHLKELLNASFNEIPENGKFVKDCKSSKYYMPSGGIFNIGDNKYFILNYMYEWLNNYYDMNYYFYKFLN
mgnify:CR=1 FL=1